MDIQTRKIEFIKAFLKIQNEDAISHFEKLLKKETQSAPTPQFQSLTVDELNQRADQSMIDSKNGRLTESNNLISEVQEWS